MHPVDIILIAFYVTWIFSLLLGFRFSGHGALFMTAIIAGCWLSPLMVESLPIWMRITASIFGGYTLVGQIRKAKNTWDLFAGTQCEDEVEDDTSI